MKTCQGCGAQYEEAAPFCPQCGLGAGARRPDVATHLPEQAAYEESTAVRSTRVTRTAVGSVVAVLVVLSATIIGIVLARGPGPTEAGTSALGTNTVADTQVPGPSAHVTAPGVEPETGKPPSNPPSTPAGTTPATSPAAHEPLVQVAPALQGRPGVAEIVSLFTRYFGAINDKDRERWEATLVPRRHLDWAGLATTTDLDIRLSAVDRDTTPIRASVSFVSHQAPQYGNGSACTDWSMIYPLSEYAGALRIDIVNFEIISRQPCSG